MNIPVTNYWRLLSRYLRPERPRVALLAVALLAGIGLDVATPQVVRAFIDGAMAGKPADLLAPSALFFFGLALARQAAAVISTWVGENVGWAATNRLRADLALHCLKLDLTFHNARTPGELVERIDGDVTALASFFSQLAIKVIGNALLLVAVLAALFAEDWRVGIAVTGFAIGALVLLIRLRSVAVPHWLKVRAKAAEFAGFVGERLAGAEDLRGLGAVPYTMRQFYTLLREWLPLDFKGNVAAYSMWVSTILTFAVGTAVSLLIGAALWRAGAITLGGVYLIFSYSELIRRPVEQIRQQMDELQRAGASINRVERLFSVKSALVEPARSQPALPVASGKAPELGVRFEHVSFHYETAEPVLEDVSFTLPAGKVLGLLGRTGSGKSTMARLLLRMYDPQRGEVSLSLADPGMLAAAGAHSAMSGSGVLRFISLVDVPVAEVRHRVSLVTQEVQVFHASVRDNLTFFADAIPDSRINSELTALGLANWARALPKGLDSQLKTGGTGLSAGEAQLLAFARIFLRDPSVVVLDEASSRLDPVTEARIERAVDRLLAGRTGIIIAHRLATVERADYILILEGGRVAEFGPREALARDPLSRFAGLLRTGLEEVLV